MVARLLEKDPADRPATAAEVVELLLPIAPGARPGRRGGARATRRWRSRELTAGDPGAHGGDRD